MTCIKGVNRSASVALSPESPYLAADTMAGAVHLSFSSSANLEIYKLDFQFDDHDLPLVGGVPSSERYNRISWGKTGGLTERYSHGLIVGGLVDGNVDIVRAAAAAEYKFPDPIPDFADAVCISVIFGFLMVLGAILSITLLC